MSGGYRFTFAKQGGLKVVPEKLDKEGFSHVADCLQYLALVVHGGLTGYITRQLAPKKRAVSRITPEGWT
jgi:hypothetical protein